MAALTLVDARSSATHATWLRNVYPLYLHDLSAWSDDYTLDAEGRFQPDRLPYWLTNPSCRPLVAAEGGAARGFAFVGTGDFPFKSKGADHRISELFVLRAFRRGGLGRRLAREVFRLFPGRWELTVLHGNDAALAFWRAVVDEAASDRAEGPDDGATRLSFSILA
jgi:predicted acetyltransferase